MWTEANDVFKDSPDWKLEANVKCFVSIGTGEPSLRPFGDDVFSIGKTLMALATDSKRQAENFRRHHSDMVKQYRFFRFNVKHGLEDIGLEEASKRKEINSATRDYIQTEIVFQEMENCASNLSERESASHYA